MIALATGFDLYGALGILVVSIALLVLAVLTDKPEDL